MKRAPSLLPVILRFPPESARLEAWGRLLTLTAGGAELSTPALLADDERLLLAFELGERFEGVAARVARVEEDQDGYRIAELRFTDESQRRRLARVLIGVLASS